MNWYCGCSHKKKVPPCLIVKIFIFSTCFVFCFFFTDFKPLDHLIKHRAINTSKWMYVKFNPLFMDCFFLISIFFVGFLSLISFLSLNRMIWKVKSSDFNQLSFSIFILWFLLPALDPPGCVLLLASGVKWYTCVKMPSLLISIFGVNSSWDYIPL